ncbi:hypothetical protein [Streptomyces sp. cmx-10-25]|uniref:hypothetical protein n=1 Tax=Streptomyces sp. cmx-10-25 TaxID=2790919 RepID=UPI00397FBA95
MTEVALRPYALLPRQYDERKVLAITIDPRGRALWLICPDVRFPRRRAGRDVPAPVGLPFDALVVIDDGGRVRERTLHGVAVNPKAFDALPGGGFVLSGAMGPDAPSGQIFGPDGRSRRRFPLGGVSSIMPGSRCPAPHLAALSSLAMAPPCLPPPPCDARHRTPLPDPA